MRLGDRLRAAIEVECHPHDEVADALVRCLAKTIVAAAEDDREQISKLLAKVKRGLDTNVELHLFLNA